MDINFALDCICLLSIFVFGGSILVIALLHLGRAIGILPKLALRNIAHSRQTKHYGRDSDSFLYLYAWLDYLNQDSNHRRKH